MSQWECVAPLRRAMTTRRDLVGVACDTLDRLFSAGSHQLVRQALDADLVPFLLGLLDGRLEVRPYFLQQRIQVVGNLKILQLILISPGSPSVLFICPAFSIVGTFYVRLFAK